MAAKYVYFITSAEHRAGRTRSPMVGFNSRAKLDAFLRASAEVEITDPDNEENIDLDRCVVFRLRFGAFYFANAPLAARDVLAGGGWP